MRKLAIVLVETPEADNQKIRRGLGLDRLQLVDCEGWIEAMFIGNESDVKTWLKSHNVISDGELRDREIATH